jgi:hypothetical protein
MKKLEYIYTSKDGQIVNVIQTKVSENSKIGIGYIMQTYHFSINQINDMNLTNDLKTCLDCPLSFNQNNNKSGGCYTHKGLQRLGLNSMLKRLNRLYTTGAIVSYDSIKLDAFIIKVQQTYPLDLIRFGAYGEPIHLGEEIVNKLTSLTSNFTGYTHQYKKSSYKWSNKFFMASVHDANDLSIARFFDFRSFIAKDKELTIEGVNCPASKEAQTNLSCIKCKLCNGTSKGIKKDIYINIH